MWESWARKWESLNKMWVRDEGVGKLSLKCEKVEEISEKGVWERWAKCEKGELNCEAVDVESEKVTIKSEKVELVKVRKFGS